MSPTKPSSLDPGKPAAMPVVNSGSLEGFIKFIGILSSSPETQFASAVLGEITQQRERIHSQDEELDRLRKEILDIKERNRTTIEDMFDAKENEKAKQRDSVIYIENLRAVVNDKENNIAEYSKILRDTQQKIAKLELTCSQEVAKVSQSAKDISTLQTNLKEKDKMVDQMKTAGSKLKSMLSMEQKKSEHLEAANASMNTELQAVGAQIQKLDGFAVQSSNIDEEFVSTKFSSLWASATTELSQLLEQDVTQDALKEKPIWEKLRKANSIVLPPNFPLIPSNSSATKAIRFALILAVLSREINRHIFQPSYFFSESTSIRETLDRLAESNGEKETFCRRVLLSIDPSAEQDALKAEIQTVVLRMSSYAGGLFPGAQHDLFCTKIKAIVQDAAEIWLQIQRSQQKFETDFEIFDPEDNEWDCFDFAGENTTPVIQDLQGVYLLNIFPCIYLAEDHNHEPLTKMIQLRSSQEFYLAAQNEATQIASSAITRRSSTRPRRQSTAGSNGKSFLGGNSTKG